MIYGNYKSKFKLKVEEKKLFIELKEKKDFFVYTRELHGEKIEKLISKSNFEIFINPVEPLNLPDEISSYILIKFKKSFFLGPKSKEKIYIKFPVEIGVFVKERGDIEIIDIFSFLKNKFTLYGDVRNGIVCKYFESDVYKEIPKTDILKEGIIELSLINQTREWVELNKVVFNAYLMKIYFSDKLVSCISKMEIKSKVIAETSFIDRPLFKNMKKSTELFVTRRLPGMPAEFIMEFGL